MSADADTGVLSFSFGGNFWYLGSYVGKGGELNKEFQATWLRVLGCFGCLAICPSIFANHILSTAANDVFTLLLMCSLYCIYT